MYGTMSLGDSSRLSKRHIYEVAFSKVLDAARKAVYHVCEGSISIS